MDNEKKKILIVEDEKNIAQMLAFNLSQAGYDFDIAYEGEEGLKKALDEDFDLILLDIMLPKLDGFEVCRRIRVKKSTPIIIVTAREEEIDKILGLDLGADDYVTKPFSIKVLLARVKSNIRRASNELVNGTSGDNPEVIRIRDLMIDCERYQVTNRGEQIMLTKKEYELLLHLARNKGKVFSREQLLEEVWGYEGFYGDQSTVDVTISRLRSKLEIDSSRPEYLFTKRSMGYYIK
ncbi:MAG TPA: response regulator transcription factor [Clostridiales bacterium]|jgi:two-component system response regulator VicR|nr:response regulator transcription factor [Clostridiales bacterium]